MSLKRKLGKQPVASADFNVSRCWKKFRKVRTRRIGGTWRNCLLQSHEEEIHMAVAFGKQLKGLKRKPRSDKMDLMREGLAMCSLVSRRRSNWVGIVGSYSLTDFRLYITFPVTGA